MVLADIDAARRSRRRVGELRQGFGTDEVRGVRVRRDRRSAGAARRSPTPCGEFGGLDILVSNAGIASAAPIEETTLDLWNTNMDILATGYFLVAREAFR